MSVPILIVEDEVKIATLLQDYCRESGYDTHIIHNGREAQEWLQNNPAKLILLDVMLPEVDGITICKEHRYHSETPIIMVTAKVEEIDRLIGLELGADDYICKPFSPRELMARIKSVLRRTEKTNTPSQVDNTDSLTLDEERYTVSYNQMNLSLTAIEFKLLQSLHNQSGKILSRDQLMTHSYSDNRIVSDRTIDSHIKKLRQKLAQFELEEELIQSVYGIGYRFQGI
ncbi:MAG: response regulator [Cocleimonas sp.]